MSSAHFRRARRRALLLSSVAAAMPAVAAQASDIETIHVRAYPPTPVAQTVMDPRDPSLRPASDGGDLLRLFPGVTGGRMGGHGIEPVIRGQKQTQINVINDGATVQGACSNRMDPPTSIADVDTADRITVLRGYQSVLYGAGGPGGTVVIEHLPPRFEAGRNAKGDASAGFESNGDVFSASSDAAARSGGFFVRGSGRVRDADNYRNGAGDEIRSAFTQYGGRVSVGYSADPADPERSDFVQATFDYDRTDDALFAGAGMDSLYSESVGMRIAGQKSLDSGALQGVRANAYWSDVDHAMDNFTHRTLTSGFRRAITESRSYGARVFLDFAWDGKALTLGGDFEAVDRDGTRFGHNTNPANVTLVQAIVWPDVSLRQYGLFGEGEARIGEGLRLTAGLRYTRVDFDFGRASEAPTLPSMGMLRSPNMLYNAFYGYMAADAKENNVSGLVRLEADLSENAMLYIAASRAVRTADATERAIASEMGAMSWIGNPRLDPERHHGVDLGAVLKGGKWTADAAIYYVDVADYILRDSARGQPGILVNAPMADVYRNIDASLAGAELALEWKPTAEITFKADATYTYGKNRETGGPLPQIPPLQGSLNASYAKGIWEAGGRLAYAFKQTRADTDPMTGSGGDVRETPGYAVLDLYASAEVTKGVSLRGGVSNVFDKTYANHLNRENSVDNVLIQVDEPGRSFYAKLVAAF